MQTKYLCKVKYSIPIMEFSSEPVYDVLLDHWIGEGFRVLTYEEAGPYLGKVTFENSPYKIESNNE